MKKYVKFIVLFFIVLVLTGCGVKWDDFYKENSAILDKGVFCDYSSGENGGVYGIDSIKFSADKNGFYTGLNGGSPQTILSKDNFTNYVILDGNYVYFNDFEFEEYIKDYKTLKTCPKSIYITDSVGTMYFKYKCVDALTCLFRYDLKNGSDILPDDKPINTCKMQAAESCSKVYKKVVGKDTFYIELGKIKNSSVIENYFMVADNENFNGESHAIGSSDLFATYKSNNFWLYSKDYGVLGLNEGKYLFDIALQMDNLYDVNMKNYTILDKLDKDHKEDDVISGGASAEKDESLNEIPKPNIEGISLCDENGIQQSFQVIGYLLFVVKILVPLLLIILGTIDFSKAIITSDDKAIKEASSKLIKRVIIGVVIFLIPTILNFAFSLVDGAKETSSGFTKCTDCLFNPNDKTKCSPKKIGE